MTKSWSFRVRDILELFGNFHVVSAAYKQKRTTPKAIFPGPGFSHLTEIAEESFWSSAEDVERDVHCFCTPYKDYTEATKKNQRPTANTNKPTKLGQREQEQKAGSLKSCIKTAAWEIKTLSWVRYQAGSALQHPKERLPRSCVGAVSAEGCFILFSRKYLPIFSLCVKSSAIWCAGNTVKPPVLEVYLKSVPRQM